jgi:hypothetical protein
MARPTAREREELTSAQIVQTYEKYKSLPKAAADLHISSRTLQRELNKLGVRRERGRPPDLPLSADHLAIAAAGAKALPDLREARIVLRDVDGNAIHSRSFGAYTIGVSKSNPDHIRIRSTLVNGQEVEIHTTITPGKELLSTE